MSAARHLLFAARGAGSYILPAPPAPDSGVFTLTNASDGAWNWVHQPRAVHYDGYVYVGYADGSGNVCLRSYQIATGAVGNEIVLKAELDVDDHINPGLLVRASDNKLMAWYARHEPASTTIHQRISTTSLDADPTLTDGFDAEVDLDSQLGGNAYDYPSPIQLSSGDIHLYFRNLDSASTYGWYRSILANGADPTTDWGARSSIYSGSHYYLKPLQNGDRIDFVVQNGSPNIENVSIGHFYWSGGSFFQTDGTEISDPPFNFTEVTEVHPFADGNSYFYDLAKGADTHPRILYAVFPNSEGTDITYWHARWNGSAWVTAEIITAGDSLSTNHPFYANGICFDLDDPTILWASKGTGDVREISRYTTEDEETWSEEAITADSANKNTRPYKVPGTDLALWLTGTYSTYSSFSQGITGHRPAE